MNENVNNPEHYGGAQNPFEAIKVIEAWDLNFSLGNAVKYISRAGIKDPRKHLEDLQKARWYVGRELERLDPSRLWNETSDKRVLSEYDKKLIHEALVHFKTTNDLRNDDEDLILDIINNKLNIL